MGQILQKWRVLGAVFIALTVVGGSYLLARSVDIPSIAQASAETALLQAAATKDSTGDGLPDWQKSLYGIPLDATTTDYFHLGMTDGEAVAKGLIVPKAVANDSTTATSTDQGTLTDSFSKAFFSLYLSTKQANGGADLSAGQTTALANEALTQFIENFAPPADFKELTDLKQAGVDSGSLTEFAAAAEAVFDRYASKTPVRELESVQGALQNSDPSSIAELESVSTIYREYAVGLAALAVPGQLAAADLALINAFAQRADIYAGIAHAKTDPLTAIVSLQELAKNESAWAKAFADIGAAYASANVSLSDGTPGAAFLKLALRLNGTP